MYAVGEKMGEDLMKRDRSLMLGEFTRLQNLSSDFIFTSVEVDSDRKARFRLRWLLQSA